MYRLSQLGAAAAVAALFAGAEPARAADLGGDCCADLEERVAELEATTVRKGNRKVSLTISGHVNHAVLFWDDGDESNAYVVGNANDDLSMFRFEGDAKIGNGWTSGYLIELELQTSGSGDVTQLNDNPNAGVLAVSDSSLWVMNEKLGKVSWGFTAMPSDGAPEMDLSGTHYVGYANVNAVAGSFLVRRADTPGAGGVIPTLMLGSFMDDLNGDTFQIVRYDTPSIAGFTLSASWGEDDMWDVALAYEGSFGSIQVAGAIAYVQNSDEDAGELEVDQNTLIGSISLLDTMSGLNITFAAGRREFDQTFLNNLNVGATRNDDQVFYYVKGGWRKNVSGMGDTALYGEYGHYDDFLSNDTDAASVQGLDINNAVACAAAGVGCFVSGSEAQIWGVGIVQYIDAAAMQLYLGYRHYEMEADLVDLNGAAVPSAALEDFDTVMAGGRIEF